MLSYLSSPLLELLILRSLLYAILFHFKSSINTYLLHSTYQANKFLTYCTDCNTEMCVWWVWNFKVYYFVFIKSNHFFLLNNNYSYIRDRTTRPYHMYPSLKNLGSGNETKSIQKSQIARGINHRQWRERPVVNPGTTCGVTAAPATAAGGWASVRNSYRKGYVRGVVVVSIRR